MELAREWVAPGKGLHDEIIQQALMYAADGGDFAAMEWIGVWIEQIHSWFHQKMVTDPSSLADTDPEANLQLATSVANRWRSNTYYYAIEQAAACGFKNAMKRLRRHVTKRERWAPREYAALNDDALISAARRGKVETLRLARQWGAVNLEEALLSAVSWRGVQAMGLLLSWGARNLDAAIAEAADQVRKIPPARSAAYREHVTRPLVWLQNYKARTVIASMGLALHSLNLPLHVELWIGEWVAFDGSVTPARRVEQILRLRESIQRVKGIPLES